MSATTGTVPTFVYLHWVAAQIRLDGAFSDDTWHKAVAAMDANPGYAWVNHLTDDDEEAAYAVLDHFRAISGGEVVGDYPRLATLLSQEELSRDDLALAASAFPASDGAK